MDQLKKVLIKRILVDCDSLYQCGAEDELFQDRPFNVEINYEDFEDKEDYRTVIRLLTKICRKKVSALVPSEQQQNP